MFNKATKPCIIILLNYYYISILNYSRENSGSSCFPLLFIGNKREASAFTMTSIFAISLWCDNRQFSQDSLRVTRLRQVYVKPNIVLNWYSSVVSNHGSHKSDHHRNDFDRSPGLSWPELGSTVRWTTSTLSIPRGTTLCTFVSEAGRELTRWKLLTGSKWANIGGEESALISYMSGGADATLGIDVLLVGGSASAANVLRFCPVRVLGMHDDSDTLLAMYAHRADRW